ncbi:MSMEG_1061 family FMN-dependent PPOX-type flavoprotein [Halalkalibacter alkaliphilus]|uniref:Pyridoxamine 5'-phosphate oxidase family protein n=1 Tax=Halalkalibacter alkaliphilus TaxID=2917993 RepID=A0A9X2CN39_9BACI|nr:MSMEG_1061 family FMN-dependent PPOX-type flavoprotein [Halalkalibacter alkaliphilus]MCL7746233.1 pyridoxamine 5'-phosphate oxidase family protein [Halalkalibacter alkaliphilus]
MIVNFAESAITTEEELRNIVGSPHKNVVNKTISVIDEHCKNFIARSPLLFLATADSKGHCDVSPRGDEPGTVLVLNDHQLVIPDRPGNKRLDSISNILSNPQIGLLFLIPGLDDVLRINGRATIIKNDDILNQMSLKGKKPLLGIGVDVEEAFIHCPRALNQSNIWNRESWEDKEALPTLMEIFHAHLKINGVEVKA